MSRIDAKRSRMTKNDLESVVCRLKSPILVFLGRYRNISSFSLAANCHFYIFSFHFWLLPRRLTQSASQKRNNYGMNRHQMLRNYKERPEKGPLWVEIAHLRVLGEIS